MPRAPRGHALLGFFVLVGLVGCAVTALLMLVPRGPRSAPFWLVAALGFTVVSAITLWRRDRVALLKVLLFATVMPALLVGMGTAFLPGTQEVGLPILAVLVLLAAGVGFGLWRELNRRTPLPNLLPQFAPGQDILERDGLQLCLQVSPRRDGALELRVTLQNCVDQERQFRLRLSSASGQRLVHPDVVEARLGPAELGLLRVPLYPAPEPGEPGVLQLQPESSGPRGARVRPRRVRAQGDTAHAVEQFLRGGSGQLPWGARLELPLPRLAQPPPPQPATAPEPSWEPLWKRGGARSAAWLETSPASVTTR